MLSLASALPPPFFELLTKLSVLDLRYCVVRTDGPTWSARVRLWVFLTSWLHKLDLLSTLQRRYCGHLVQVSTVQTMTR